jgi:zinc transport system substrate-binding protein
MLSLIANGAAARMPVAVSIPPQKYLLERIGAPHLEVLVALEPGHVPETWEPSARRIAALRGARIYFRIGVPFEERWIARAGHGDASPTIVDCCATYRDAADTGVDHVHDPHIWLDPTLALDFARVAAEALVVADPMHAAGYRENLAVLERELRALDDEIRAQLAGRRTSYFIVAHGSLGHLAAAYGLTQVAVEPGHRSPGPRALARIVDLARRERLDMLLVEDQYRSASIATLARELDARVVNFNPLREDVSANLREIAAMLAQATR